MSILKLLQGILCKNFFTKYPEKLWGIPTKDFDANWAPKRVQITEERRAFYQDQWSAVGNEGSGTILKTLESKIIALGGKINLEEKIECVELSDSHNITKIVTDAREIDLMPKDLVINTTSCTNFSKLIGFKTNLKYRGVILVMLELNTAKVLPDGVDFIYIDDEKIYFNRVSDQNSFIKDPSPDSTIMCCEITYSPNDKYDVMEDKELFKNVKDQFVGLGLCKSDQITDCKLIKLPEVYPMYIKGYQAALAETRERFDKILNLYTLGSLAEFMYADLQILFSKSIDLGSNY